MINKEKSFISVVFYLRNSEKYIIPFLENLLPSLNKYFECFEIICVNNDSTDNSINIIKQFHKENYPSISLNIVTLSYCRSIEEAMASGIDLAIGDFVFSFDSILFDYDETMIINAYKKSLEGNDVVFISPNKKVTLSQKLYYLLYNFGVQKEMKIYPERFKIISRRAINRVGKMSKFFSNNSSVLKSCGLDNTTIFYDPSKAYIKYDKLEKKERYSKAIESLILYTNISNKIMLILSIVFFISSLLAFGKVISLFYLLLSIGLFISIVIIKHMQVLLNVTHRNHVHLIRSIEKVVK